MKGKKINKDEFAKLVGLYEFIEKDIKESKEKENGTEKKPK